jgi:hypothetical protein
MPRIRPPALASRQMPANVTDLLAQRIVHTQPKLIDEVEKVFVILYEDDDFRALRGAEDPDETVHGSVVADDIVSAQAIKEKGTELGLPLLIAANLHEISIKLRGAERRYNASRKQRSAANVRASDVAPATEQAAQA